MVMGLTTGCVALLAAACGRNNGSAPGDSKVTGKAADAPVKLEASWKPDRRYMWRVEMAQHGEFPGWGRQKRMTNDTIVAQEYAITVTNAPQAGQRGLEMEILALEVQAAMGDMEFSYDSANRVMDNTGNPIAQTLSNLIGGKVYFLVGPDNKVLKLEGTKELFDRVDGPAGGGRRGGGMGAGALLRRTYSDDYFKEMVELSGLPDKAVRVGDSWPIKRVVNGGLVGDLLLDTVQIFKGWQTHERRKCARIDFDGTVAASGSNSLLGMMGRMELENGKIHGTTWVDPSLSLPVETVLDQSMDIKVALPQPGRRGTNAAAQPTNSPPQSWSGPSRVHMTIKLLDTEGGEQK